MSVQKRLLILANSNKSGGRCVAGREVLCDGDRYRLGPWVRPVTAHGEGELACCERRYADSREVAVLDVADVTLADHVGDPLQPENWNVGPRPAWTRPAAVFHRPRHAWLAEQPPDLWLEAGSPSDRVTHGWLWVHPPRQTLYVIRPEGFHVRLSSYAPDELSAVRPRYRGHFRYRGVEYDLSLTDPRVIERFAAQVPEVGQPALTVRLSCGDDLLVCVSLARCYQGRHHKVVATVFEGLS